MALIELDGVSVAFGHLPLVDRASMQIDPWERVCLIGRNGTGKTHACCASVSGRAPPPDSGDAWRQPGLNDRAPRAGCAALSDQPAPVFDVSPRSRGRRCAGHGVSPCGRSRSPTRAPGRRLVRLGQPAARARPTGRLARGATGRDGAWRAWICRPMLSFDTLSGGWRRRVLLARALVARARPAPARRADQSPRFRGDHAGWKMFLARLSPARSLVRHARSHVPPAPGDAHRGARSRAPDVVARRLRDVPGAEGGRARGRSDRAARCSTSGWPQEEAWMRQGIKARRTRNEGRVRALRRCARARGSRRGSGAVRLQARRRRARRAAGVRGRARQHVVRRRAGRARLHAAHPARRSRSASSARTAPGKTTLLRLLLGELPPDTGRLRRGATLEIAHFDQQREQLDPDARSLDTVGDGNDIVDDQRPAAARASATSRDFLFPPRTRALAGEGALGRRAQPAAAGAAASRGRPTCWCSTSRPTISTSRRSSCSRSCSSTWPGTLLLVSHDRAFLDNVVTSTLVFEGDGRVQEYVGGYEDWVRQKAAREALAAAAAPRRRRFPLPPPVAAARTAKLTYKERQELEALPTRIAALETRKQELESAINAADFHLRGAVGMADVRRPRSNRSGPRTGHGSLARTRSPRGRAVNNRAAFQAAAYSLQAT